MSNVISMGVGFIITNDLSYCLNLHLPLVAVALGVRHEMKLRGDISIVKSKGARYMLK